MKTKNLVIAIAFLLAINVTTQCFAQENIKALIKRCESMDVIDMNIVRNKNPNATSSANVIRSAWQFVAPDSASLVFYETTSNIPAIETRKLAELAANMVTVRVSQPDVLTSSSRNIRSPHTIIDITLLYTPKLEKELVAAFRKDQEESTHEGEQIKSGKVTHMLYLFDNSEYSFTIKNDTINIRAYEGSRRPQVSRTIAAPTQR